MAADGSLLAPGGLGFRRSLPLLASDPEEAQLQPLLQPREGPGLALCPEAKELVRQVGSQTSSLEGLKKTVLPCETSGSQLQRK